jgi:hypothetical protein
LTHKVALINLKVATSSTFLFFTFPIVLKNRTGLYWANHTGSISMLFFMNPNVVDLRIFFRQYKFLFYEQSDRPSLLKQDLKQDRLKDKAMANMVHLRKFLAINNIL